MSECWDPVLVLSRLMTGYFTYEIPRCKTEDMLSFHVLMYRIYFSIYIIGIIPKQTQIYILPCHYIHDRMKL